MNTARWATMLAVCWSATLCAQDSTGTIAGTVRDAAGKPIHEAQVSVDATHRALTDSLGRYVLRDIPPDTVQLQAVRLFYERVSLPRVAVVRGDTTHVDIVLPDGPRPRRAVFIPCTAGALGPDGGTCQPARQITYTGRPPMGVGIIRDSATYAAFNRRFPTADVNRIDWQHEMVLILNYDGLSGLDHSSGFNRAEIRKGELVITLGPDSLVGQLYHGQMRLSIDELTRAEALVLPRWDRQAYFETRIPEVRLPRLRDWRAVAGDTTIRR
jgi:carboxypeptidase family protein